MRSAARHIWETVGRPEPGAASVAKLLTETPATCAMCGISDQRTADADKALGANFSDRSHLRHGGNRICPGCLWACSGKPPATLRMWSIICANTTLPPSNPKAWLQHPHLYLDSRAGARHFGQFLASPPDTDWVCTIALSGQKHVAPYGVVNHGRNRWTVRMEDHNVTATPDEFTTVHTHSLAIRALGVPEQAVIDGQPAYIKTRDQLATWTHHNTALAPWRGSPLHRLTLWTITKETIHAHTHP